MVRRGASIETIKLKKINFIMTFIVGLKIALKIFSFNHKKFCGS